MIVQLIEDGDDVILPIPEEIMESMGLKEGDVLEWIINDNGDITLKVKNG